MNFPTAVKTCFQKYITVSGRAVRSEYWYWVLFTIILGIVTGILDAIIMGVPQNGESQLSPLNLIGSLVTLLPGIAVTARRLHDVNRSGWWMLLVFTIIGIIPLIYWYVSKGTEGENRFGSDPLPQQ